MSVVRCVHCNTTGRCGCFECARASRGGGYADQRQGNCLLHDLCNAAQGQEGGPGDGAKLLALMFLPKIIMGAIQTHETFRCSVCKGTGYNHFGRRRR